MRIQLIAAAAAFLLSATGATAQTRQNAAPDEEQNGSSQSAAFNAALVGAWRSAPDEMKLTSDFDKSVWGPNATSVRSVELTVRPNGEGTLRVIKKVLDARRRVVAASTWIEEAQLQLGAATPGAATRLEHDVKVVSAVRLFPDDPNYRWPLDGLRVKLVTFQDTDGNSMEVRYDTPDGRGSFWETLKRQRAGAATPRPSGAHTQPPRSSAKPQK